jgi:hypothetical protein
MCTTSLAFVLILQMRKLSPNSEMIYRKWSVEAWAKSDHKSAFPAHQKTKTYLKQYAVWNHLQLQLFSWFKQQRFPSQKWLTITLSPNSASSSCHSWPLKTECPAVTQASYFKGTLSCARPGNKVHFVWHANPFLSELMSTTCIQGDSCH